MSTAYVVQTSGIVTMDARGPAEAVRKAKYRLTERLRREMLRVGADLTSSMWTTEWRPTRDGTGERLVLLVEGDEYADAPGPGLSVPFGDVATGVARVQSTLLGRSMHRRKLPRMNTASIRSSEVG